MNKRKWIWLSVGLVVIVLISSIVIRHWNTIGAILDSFRYSEETIIRKLEENKQELQKYIDENEGIVVRDLTEEEAESLAEGNLSEEDAVKVLTGQQEDINKPAPPKQEDATDTVVSEAIAKLYIQKSIYMGKLDSIEARVNQEFYDLVHAENLYGDDKKAAKEKFLRTNLSEVAKWETECDNVVYGILDEIKTALRENNEDTAIVKKLEEAYLNEKRLKKSYFINRYMD